MNHDLRLFRYNFPFNLDNTKPYYFDTTKSDASIRLLPKIVIMDGIPDIRFQGYLTSSWDNLSLLIEPAIVNKNYGGDILGTEFTRYGISGRIINAFIRYKMKNIVLQIGRSPVWWGQSWNSSIIQSGDFPPYDHLDLKFNFGNFQIEMLTGQLSSKKWENNRIKRFIAGHKIIWLPKNNRWIFGIGEQIIYTGKNRSTEYHYINPVLSYVPTMLNELGESGISDNSDNDNGIIFAFYRYNLRPNTSFYSEFIIDEFQVDKSSSFPHSLGLKIGIDGAFNRSSSLITYLIEFNKIDSWTYIHPGQFTSWENRQSPIGYYYGPDCWSILFLFDYWIKNNALISLETTYLQKGSNLVLSKYNALNTRGDSFPRRPISTHVFNKYSFSWIEKYYMYEVGWSNVPFSSEISSSWTPEIFKGSVYFKVQLHYDFGFDLD